ncbi:MAG: YdbH domain-containing protein [bacterium]
MFFSLHSSRFTLHAFWDLGFVKLGFYLVRYVKTRRILIAIVVALLFVIVWVTVLPNFIATQIVLALQERGLPEVAVTTEAVSFKRIALDKFSVGKEKRLQVSDIDVDYSLGSLIKGRVGTILVNGAELDVLVKNGVVDLGPLVNLSGEGRGDLPFDRLELRAATLTLHWDGRVYRVPIKASLQNAGGNMSRINLQATLNQAQLTLNAMVDINTREGTGDVVLDGLTSDFLQEIGSAFFPTEKIKSEGRLNATGNFTSQNDYWQAELTLTGDQLAIHSQIDPLVLELSLTSLQVDAKIFSDSISTFNLRASLNEAPVTFNAAADIHTLDGEYELDITGLDAGILDELSAKYLLAQKLKADGSMAVKGRIAYNQGRGLAAVMLSGNQLSIETQVKNHELNITPDTLTSEVEFTYKKGEMRVNKGRLEISGWSLADMSNGLTIDDISCIAPYSWAEKAIRGGSFAFGSIRFGNNTLPKFSGAIKLKNDRLDLTANGQLFPEAKLDASAWLDWSGDEPSGEISAHIPRFTTENDDALGELFPALSGNELSGTFAVDVQLKLGSGQLRPYFRLNIQDALWKNPSSEASEAGLSGLNGVITLNSFSPLTTAGEQRFTIKSAYSGALQVTNGVIDFHIENNDSIFLKLIECEWAGGKVLSRDMFLEPSKSRVSLDLQIEGLQLQKILGFVKYDGVKGDGEFYGHLPIHLDWSSDGHISFGNGFLEARPSKGGLQVSKENAMAILGIREEIDPKTASQQEMVSLMLLRALQDMEYTKLKVVFNNERDQGWVTYVQAQGYGPRSDKENQVPIGGLDININALDELLNRIIFSKLDMSQIKFGNE